MMEEYLKVKDIQDILQISRNKAYRLVNQDDFPKIRCGRDIRIPKSKFNEFMDSLLYKTYHLY